MQIINTDLLKHPLNWIIVMMMLIIAGFVVDIAAHYHMSRDQSVSGA